MADVFVAGVLLALYALKSHEATQSIPYIGLSYFIGYCLLSMTTTELLVHSDAVSGKERRKPEKGLGHRAIAALAAGFLCIVLGAGVYTYEQYPWDSRDHDAASSLPRQLKDTDLAPPPRK
jgi:hypothetical protein